MYGVQPPCTRYINRRGYTGANVTATVIADRTVSFPSRLVAMWVGTAGGVLKVSAATSFGVSDLYFVTTVTLQNVGTTTLTQVLARSVKARSD